MDNNEIFNKARKISDPEVRDEYLRLACGDDSDAIGQIKKLLKAASDESSSPQTPSLECVETQVFTAESSRLGQLVGLYKILQEIGEGGMGSVFMAEQEKPVRRRVALKIIKPGNDDKQLIARFEAERQALAMMDHPNIAKVLDAGQADDGSPYLVMELVQGIPITKYCDQNKLTPIERLKLFVPVCKAIQHAHQKGILHRDLKPANVLVCIQDGVPVPKVIDFGLAKPLQHQIKLTDKTMFTEFGQVLGTVQYMSPEQAVLDALDVDTRSDIYSLGIMLYELLSGSTPVDHKTLKQNALLKVLEIIRESDPPRPSVRFHSSKEKLTAISQQRKIPPLKLEQILRNELDWVVMKALEKDRTRRYESASDFALDIERYLNGDAVVARPPSVLYRTSKYVRKHKGFFATALTITAFLVIAFALIAWQRAEAARLRVVKRVEATMDSLETGRGSSIPIILEQLDSLPTNLVVDELEKRFDGATGQQKLNLAYGLAHFGQVEIDMILDGLLWAETEPDEIDNFVAALRIDESKSLGKLKSSAKKATSDKSWISKARLAIVALHLGEESLAAEMLRDQPESSQSSLELPDQLSDFQKQIKEFTALPKGLRNSPKIRMKLAEANYLLGEYDNALVELNQLDQQVGGSNWRSKINRLIIEVGEGFGGFQRYQEILAFCQAHVGLAQASQESLELLAKVSGSKIRDSYGQILVEAGLGNLEAAEEQLKQLIEDWPKDGGVQYVGARIAAQLMRICRERQLSDAPRFREMTFRLLRTACLELGYVSEIDTNPDFIPLHQDPDFLLLVAEIKPTLVTFDPIQRTVFIREFTAWSGSVASLAEKVANTQSKALRSGICLALGGVKKPGQQARANWQPVLSHWYATAADNGTHSASGWTLAQWNLETPEIANTQTPPSERAWWHEPHGLRLVRINSGSVTGEKGLIKIQDDFWLSDSEITVGLFQQFMADVDYHAKFPELMPDWKEAGSWKETGPVPYWRKDKTINYAITILDKYDKDKDGELDETESNSIGLPSGTDKNADGKISLYELIVGYGGSSSPRTSSPSSLTSSNDKIVSYTKSILEKYDKDGDGVLDTIESTGGRALPAGADKNGDGKITLEELIFGYGGKSSPGTSVPSSSSFHNDRTATYAMLGLERYDENGDGVLDATELKDIGLPSGTDKNADGKITLYELIDGYGGNRIGSKKGNNIDSPNLPVEKVSWNDAVMFCNWLSDELGFDPCYDVTKTGKGYAVKWNRMGNGIRLPTEAEWEYACRSFTTTRFSFGNDERDLLDYGWFSLNGNSRRNWIRGKACNAWGLFDLHGNVSEWCWTIPTATLTRRQQLHRGGGQDSTSRNSESSSGIQSERDNRSLNLGFRVARGPSSQASPASE